MQKVQSCWDDACLSQLFHCGVGLEEACSYPLEQLRLLVGMKPLPQTHAELSTTMDNLMEAAVCCGRLRLRTSRMALHLKQLIRSVYKFCHVQRLGNQQRSKERQSQKLLLANQR